MEKIVSEKFRTSESLEVGRESWIRSYSQPINPSHSQQQLSES